MNDPNIFYNSKIKIAIFLPNLDGGGAEKVFINLAKILKKRGFETKLIIGFKSGILVKDIVDLEVLYLNKESVTKCILPLSQYLSINPPSILLSGMPHANLAAILAGRLANKGIKIITSVHENPIRAFNFLSFKDKLILNLLRIAYPFSDALIAVSEGLLKAQIGFYKNRLPKKVLRIYNPIVDFEVRNECSRVVSSNDKINIISAGRLNIQKGFEILIEAFSILDISREVTLTIYGEGPERKKLQNLINKLQLHDKVFLPGFDIDLSSRMQEADVFVLSSKWEGFGNVLVEALSFGCQVISTDCDNGPSEILNNGEYGFLVPVDDVFEMKKAIESVVNGNSIKYNVFEATLPFTFKKVGDEYVSLLESLINLKDGSQKN